MSSGFCPKCGSAVDIALPVEPLFSLDTAIQLLPTTRGALEQRLSRHKSKLAPPTYVWWRGTRRRMLTAADIRILRGQLASHERWPRTKRSDERRRRAAEAAAAAQAAAASTAAEAADACGA